MERALAPPVERFRWQLAPLFIAWIIRWIDWAHDGSGGEMIFPKLEIFCFVLSAFLCTAFAQPIHMDTTGPYKTLGLRDVFLPYPTPGSSRMMNLRLLYPCDRKEHPEKQHPHFINSRTFNYAFMKFGNKLSPAFSWLISHWALLQLPVWANGPLYPPQALPRPSVDHEGKAIKHKKVKTSTGKYPLVIFSHGLGGNKEMYSALCLELASHGYVVGVMEHMDGSALLVRTPDGKVYHHDYDYFIPEKNNEQEKYKEGRRQQCEHRLEDILALRTALKARILEEGPLSPGSGAQLTDFKGCIDFDRTAVIGHSFGGATAIAAAITQASSGREDSPFAPFRALVVYDPACAWMPLSIQNKLFQAAKSVPLVPPTLGLWSEDWFKWEWGMLPKYKEAVTSGAFAPGSAIYAIPGSGHFFATDIMLLLPVWMSRYFQFTRVNGEISMMQTRASTIAFLDLLVKNDYTHKAGEQEALQMALEKAMKIGP
eukprot:g316.t1